MSENPTSLPPKMITEVTDLIAQVNSIISELDHEEKIKKLRNIPSASPKDPFCKKVNIELNSIYVNFAARQTIPDCLDTEIRQIISNTLHKINSRGKDDQHPCLLCPIRRGMNEGARPQGAGYCDSDFLGPVSTKSFKL